MYCTDGAGMSILNRFIASTLPEAEAATYVRLSGRVKAATSRYANVPPPTSWPVAGSPASSVPFSCTRISWTPFST